MMLIPRYISPEMKRERKRVNERRSGSRWCKGVERTERARSSFFTKPKLSADVEVELMGRDIGCQMKDLKGGVSNGSKKGN